MNRWRQTLLGLVALTLAPTLYAANPCLTGGAPMMRDGSGTGGAGLRPEAGDGTGQGGTGISAGKFAVGGDGSGSGGTGISQGKLSVDGDGSGTGRSVEVDGVITGFASICVNGLELNYLPSTPITINGNAASAKDLRVGQVVRALAHGQGDQLALQHIRIRHLLVAQVDELAPGKIRAQGRSITIIPNMELPAGLTPGVKVAVSGFADVQGHVVATRLDVVPNDTPDSIEGVVHRTPQGRLVIDNVALGGDLSKLEPGDIIRAEGRYADGWMQITRHERAERAMTVDRVVIQGFVRHAALSELNVNGQRFLIDSRTQIKQPLRAGEWAKVDAIREGRHYHAREVETHTQPENDMLKPAQGKDNAPRRAGRQEKTHAQDEERSSEFTVEHSSRETEAIERPEAPEKVEAPERIERPEKIEAPERLERPETIEAPDRIERPEKIEAPERIERPEKIEAPERVERPEKIEAPERIERPEKIEIH
ncbi:MAG: DUF5666 domain-containing protein [Thiobacillus sp.]